MSYWDTSALVKLYLRESDSRRFEELAEETNRLVTAAFARHEVRAAFRRREAEGALAAGESATLFQLFDGDNARGEIEAISDSAAVEAEFAGVLETCLSRQPPIFIRTLDAWHLASARVSGETEFVTADLRQRAAALALAFNVLPT
ncbi:MAG TPA: type II toxin-antitoxin system VapC family toxin [Chthoniobacteraceae bacterium]|nr:type II toxin-antitoxin system VapC family toxin [Chthoniobacteraceae bacterium]